MTDRRQFLKASIATSTLVASLPVNAAAMFAVSPNKALADFIYDDRYLPAFEIAQELSRHPTRTHAISAGMAELWYDVLAPALANGPRKFGGLTTLGGLFVMARLGHDAGLTLALHGSHQLSVDGRPITHALAAPEHSQRRFMASLARGMLWTSALKTELLTLASRSVTDRFEMPDMKSNDLAGHTTLHSWLLVPRA